MDKMELEQKALSLPDQAGLIKVTSEFGLIEATEFRKTIKALRKEASDIFDPIISQAHKAHKEALAAKKKVDGPLAEADRIVSRASNEYQAKIRREQEAERRKLEAEARARAEEERLAAAIAAEEAHAPELVEAILEEPVMPAPIVKPPAPAKVEGLVTRETWKARITDQAALIAWIGANSYMHHLIKAIDLSALNSMARRQKEALSIPGVEAYAEISTHTRG